MSLVGELEGDPGMYSDLDRKTFMSFNPMLVAPPFITTPGTEFYERTQDLTDYEQNENDKMYKVPPITSFTNLNTCQANQYFTQDGDSCDKEEYTSHEVLKQAQVGKITYDFEPTTFPEICTNLTTTPGQYCPEDCTNQMIHYTDHRDSYSTHSLQAYDYRKSSVSSTDSGSTVHSEEEYNLALQQNYHNISLGLNYQDQPYYDHNQQMHLFSLQRQCNEDMYVLEPDSTTYGSESQSYKPSNSRSCNPYRPDSPTYRFRKGRRTRGPKLWEFLWELLHDPTCNPEFIVWQDREKKIFRIVKSKNVAQLWGLKKQKKGMTYEFMSRAMRYYYKKHIMYRIKDKRLVYQFGPAALHLQSPMHTRTSGRCL